MEYIREVVDSEKLSGLFDLPFSLRGCEVEVTVLPVLPAKKNIEKKKVQLCNDSAFGGLSKYANPALIPLEEGAWERAAVEKYTKEQDNANERRKKNC
jgi:hypothetical protein